MSNQALDQREKLMYRIDYRHAERWCKLTTDNHESAMHIATLLAKSGCRVEVWNGSHLLFEGN